MTQAPKQAYEAWRITHQSSELAARSAFDTAEMLQQELLTARATISNLERDELTAITQRDDASDFIDKILDEVLGQDRHEWTSAYDRDDALADVEAKMAALKSSKCLHQIAEPAAQSEGEAFQALSELTNALRERHYGRMPAEVQAAYDKAWTIVFTGEKSAPAAPQAVQPAIMPKGESAAAQLRAMATNYPAGHNWDKLDARACIRGALEIEALRALLAAAPAHPAEGVPALEVNDAMALAFHHALTDGSIGADDLEEIKIGLRAVLANVAATQPAAQGLDAVRALIELHSKELEQNVYAYFELAHTRQTGWCAWITDHPRSMPPVPVINPDRKVIASGQGDTPDAACAAALAAQAKQGGA